MSNLFGQEDISDFPYLQETIDELNYESIEEAMSNTNLNNILEKLKDEDLRNKISFELGKLDEKSKKYYIKLITTIVELGSYLNKEVEADLHFIIDDADDFTLQRSPAGYLSMKMEEKDIEKKLATTIYFNMKKKQEEIDNTRKSYCDEIVERKTNEIEKQTYIIRKLEADLKKCEESKASLDSFDDTDFSKNEDRFNKIAQKIKKECDDEIARLNSENESLKTANSILTKQILDVEKSSSTNQICCDEIGELNKKIQEKELTISKCKAEFETKITQIAIMKEKIEKLNVSGDEKDEKTEKVLTELRECRDSKNNIQKLSGTIKSALDKCEIEKTNFKQKHDELNQQIDDLKIEIRSLSEVINERKEIDRDETEKENLSILQLNELEEKKNDCESKLKNLEDEISKLNSMRNNISDLKNISNERDRLQEEITILKEEAQNFYSKQKIELEETILCYRSSFLNILFTSITIFGFSYILNVKLQKSNKLFKSKAEIQSNIKVWNFMLFLCGILSLVLYTLLLYFPKSCRVFLWCFLVLILFIILCLVMMIIEIKELEKFDEEYVPYEIVLYVLLCIFAIITMINITSLVKKGF